MLGLQSALSSLVVSFGTVIENLVMVIVEVLRMRRKHEIVLQSRCNLKIPDNYLSTQDNVFTELMMYSLYAISVFLHKSK